MRVRTHECQTNAEFPAAATEIRRSCDRCVPLRSERPAHARADPTVRRNTLAPHHASSCQKTVQRFRKGKSEAPAETQEVALFQAIVIEQQVEHRRICQVVLLIFQKWEPVV